MGWLLEEGLVGFLPREYLRGQVTPDMQSAISFLTSPVTNLPRYPACEIKGEVRGMSLVFIPVCKLHL